MVKGFCRILYQILSMCPFASHGTLRGHIVCPAQINRHDCDAFPLPTIPACLETVDLTLSIYVFYVFYTFISLQTRQHQIL